jgi:hypothetical protein
MTERTRPERSRGNGRITTRQFYEALIESKDQMAEMERRLAGRIERVAEKIDGLPQLVEHNRKDIQRNYDAIEKIQSFDNKMKFLSALIAAVTGGIVSLFVRDR